MIDSSLSTMAKKQKNLSKMPKEKFDSLMKRFWSLMNYKNDQIKKKQKNV